MVGFGPQLLDSLQTDKKSAYWSSTTRNEPETGDITRIQVPRIIRQRLRGQGGRTAYLQGWLSFASCIIASNQQCRHANPGEAITWLTC